MGTMPVGWNWMDSGLPMGTRPVSWAMALPAPSQMTALVVAV